MKMILCRIIPEFDQKLFNSCIAIKTAAMSHAVHCVSTRLVEVRHSWAQIRSKRVVRCPLPLTFAFWPDHGQHDQRDYATRYKQDRKLRKNKWRSQDRKRDQQFDRSAHASRQLWDIWGKRAMRNFQCSHVYCPADFLLSESSINPYQISRKSQ